MTEYARQDFFGNFASWNFMTRLQTLLHSTVEAKCIWMIWMRCEIILYLSALNGRLCRDMSWLCKARDPAALQFHVVTSPQLEKTLGLVSWAVRAVQGCLVTEFAWPLRQRTAQIVLVCSCFMIWTFDCQFDWGFTLSRNLSLRQRLERRGQLKPFWPDESDEHFAKDVGYLSARCENPGWMNDPIGDARFWRQTVSKHSMGIFKLRTKEITVRSLTSHDQPLSIFFNQFRLFFSQMSYGRQVHTNPSVLRKIRLLPARAYT